MTVNIEGIIVCCILNAHLPTVLPAKSDSDDKFCLQSYQGLL